jgi:hypothetical protein
MVNNSKGASCGGNRFDSGRNNGGGYKISFAVMDKGI